MHSRKELMVLCSDTENDDCNCRSPDVTKMFEVEADYTGYWVV